MKFSFPQILLPALAALLVACLLPLPYGFFVLVRFVAAGAFALLAINAFDRASNTGRGFRGTGRCSFSLFFKLALGRPLWNIVDVAVAGWLLYLWLKGR